ncbi:hypothetical protein NECAME_02155 [Necator americanus]|uniref:Secreted protein n=1 Tax=Necator americanus TaxID=51031 RepID=W2THE0_NECAM|nr:hypothetical protein NECAME_02155 [Necator americanus]ETN81475.1 hypothetical protein NECAME_02155 [Necator americanus]
MQTRHKLIITAWLPKCLIICVGYELQAAQNVYVGAVWPMQLRPKLRCCQPFAATITSSFQCSKDFHERIWERRGSNQTSIAPPSTAQCLNYDCLNAPNDLEK